MSKPNMSESKNSLKILLVENINSIAKDRLESECYHFDLLTHAPTEDCYLKLLPKYQ